MRSASCKFGAAKGRTLFPSLLFKMREEKKKKKAFQEEWGFYDSVNKKYLSDLHTNTRRIISFPFLGSGYCSFAVVILTAQYISGYVGYSILLTISEPIFYFVFFAHAHSLHTHACTHTITKKKDTAVFTEGSAS